MSSLTVRAGVPAPAAGDRLGILVSSLCAVHCAAVAVLPVALASMGLSGLLGHDAEWGFTLAAVSVAGFAWWSGWRRHRSARPLVLLGAGITGLLLSRVVEEAGIEGIGTMIAVASGALLVIGHVVNLRSHRVEGRPCCERA